MSRPQQPSPVRFIDNPVHTRYPPPRPGRERNPTSVPEFIPFRREEVSPPIAKDRARPTLHELRLRETGQLKRPIKNIVEGLTKQRSYERQQREYNEQERRYADFPLNPLRALAPGSDFYYRPTVHLYPGDAFDTYVRPVSPEELRRQEESKEQVQRAGEAVHQAEIIRQAHRKQNEMNNSCIASGKPLEGSGIFEDIKNWIVRQAGRFLNPGTASDYHKDDYDGPSQLQQEYDRRYGRGYSAGSYMRPSPSCE